MRKHDVRKWLHAILDLLPVIIIPVFMIYSHRHTIDNYEVQYAQNEVVDFNQLAINGNLDDTSYFGNYSNISDNILTFKATHQYESFNYRGVSFVPNNKYLLRFDFLGNTGYFDIYTNHGDYFVPSLGYVNYNTFTNFSCIVTIQSASNYLNFQDNRVSDWTDLQFKNFNIFNLTQMFGSGNEPTIEEFNTYYPNDYYDYTLSHKELLNVGTTTYNDTDIGSQMLYCLYNSVDKYFNLNNVFGFNNVYDWLSLNIFNGNPPIAIYIVWNIALYEFLMDLIMLLYALFMWFIDMCESLIDRSFHVASGRKK